LVLGVLTAAAELVFFASLHGQAQVSKETSLYLFLSFTQLVVIFSVRNHDHFRRATPMWRPLLAALAVTAAVTLAIPYTHRVGHFFGFHAPSAGQVAAVLAGSVTYLFARWVVTPRVLPRAPTGDPTGATGALWVGTSPW
jgi:hypothetical protein